MTPDSWKQLEVLFLAVIDLNPAERDTYLKIHCKDEKLRRQIDNLLKNDSQNKDEIRNRIFNEAAELLSHARIGETLGAYTLEKEIGHGGMGTVYLASRSDDAFEKRVAIKILHSKLATKLEQERFLSERQILADLEHANIARLLDGGSCNDGSPYLVMEFVDGESLDEYCRNSELPEIERLKLFFQICNAIEYAHKNHILHCDIKPKNILVSREGTAKLVDFGIAQLTSSSNSADETSSAIALTLVYASPEQISGEPLQQSSDVYTLGLLLYEILTQQRPPPAQNRLLSLNADLHAILRRALDQNPRQRYPSVTEFRQDLLNYLDKRPVAARPHSGIHRISKFIQRNPASSVSLLFIFIITLLITYFISRPGPVRAPIVSRVIQTHTNNSQQSIKIAVLPFHSKTEKPFAQGITGDLIRDLSKLKQLNVIALNSTKQFNSANADLDTISIQLGVRYIVQGEIGEDEETLRVKVSVLDTRKNLKLWQKSYQRPTTELFELQKLISANIVEIFNLSLTKTENRLLTKRYTDSLAAYDYFLRGLSHYGQRLAQANSSARENMEKAISLDPKFARAYAVLANTHRADFVNRWSRNPAESIRLANRFADIALRLDPDLAQAHFVKGLIQREQKLHFQAMTSAANAIALNPNYADAFILLASVMCYSHSAEKSIELIQKAVRLNPIHPINYQFHLGQCYFVLEQYEMAIRSFEQAIERNPTSQRSNLWLAASYVSVGRIQDAQWVMTQLLDWNPELTLTHIQSVTPFSEKQDIQHFLIALKTAGMKE